MCVYVCVCVCVCVHVWTWLSLQVTKVYFLVLSNGVKSLEIEKAPLGGEIRDDRMTVYIYRSFKSEGNRVMCKHCFLNRLQLAFQPQNEQSLRSVWPTIILNPGGSNPVLRQGIFCFRLSPPGLCFRDSKIRVENAPSPLCSNNWGHLTSTWHKTLS